MYGKVFHEGELIDLAVEYEIVDKSGACILIMVKEWDKVKKMLKHT